MTAIIQGKRRSLEAAKSRFVTSVNEGVDELMRRCGYSRERATCALLRELGRGDVGATTDDEIFSVMTRYGLGVDDAAHALTVSRAFHRATKERGLTAVEAIDDLLSKLSIKKLVSSSGDISEPRKTEVLPPRPSEQLRTSPTIAATTSQFTTAQRKGRKSTTTSTTAKPVHKNGKQKGLKGNNSSKHASRKRPSPTNEEGKQGFSSSSSRARADSVTEAVEAKAKKARLSPEEASPSPSDAVMVRAAKRVHRADTDVQSNTV